MDPQDLANMALLGPQPAPVDATPNPFGPDPSTGQGLPPQLAEADLSFLPPLPGTEPPAPASPGLVPQSKGISSSSSQQGFSEEKSRQVRKGPGAELRRDLAAIPGQVEAKYAPMRNEQNAVMDDTAAAMEEMQSVKQDQLVEQGKAQEDRAFLERAYLRQVKAAQENSALEIEASMTKYKASVEDWAASEVNPGKVFDQAGGFATFGMGAAAFVHDFLGVKGMKTSAMDTFNRAQEVNIAAQVENIRKKGQVSAAFKGLWEMTVQQSASEQEAMAKMHGYSLKALEAETTAAMGKFDSRLAGAQHQAALAQIRQARLDNDMKIYGLVSRDVSEATKNRIDFYGQELRSADARAQNATSLKVAQMQLDAAKAKAEKPAAAKRRIVDPFGNVERWEFKDGITDTEIAKVTEHVGKYEDAATQLGELRAITREAGPVNDLTAGTRFSPEIQRRVAAKANQIARTMIAAKEDGRVSDADVKQVMEGLKNTTTLTVGGVSTILADAESALHKGMTANMRQYVVDLPDGVGNSGPKRQINEDKALEADATANVKIAPANDPTNPIAHTKYTLGRPDRFKPILPETATKILGGEAGNGAQTQLNTEFEEFVNSDKAGNWKTQAVNNRAARAGYGSTFIRGAAAQADENVKAFKKDSLGNTIADPAFATMARLARLAMDGKSGALEELDKYSKLDEVTTKEANDLAPKLSFDDRKLVADYARWYEERVMGSNPNIQPEQMGPTLKPSK